MIGEYVVFDVCECEWVGVAQLLFVARGNRDCFSWLSPECVYVMHKVFEINNLKYKLCNIKVMNNNFKIKILWYTIKDDHCRP